MHGGPRLTRRWPASRSAWCTDAGVLLADPDLDRDAALTAVLSGRADLVASAAAFAPPGVPGIRTSAVGGAGVTHGVGAGG